MNRSLIFKTFLVGVSCLTFAGCTASNIPADTSMKKTDEAKMQQEPTATQSQDESMVKEESMEKKDSMEKEDSIVKDDTMTKESDSMEKTQ